MQLGEHNAIKTCTSKGMVCIVCHFTLFKNWLKHIFVLTAYVWEAAPCSSLPTADENAVTESAVTTVSSSLGKQSAKGTKRVLGVGAWKGVGRLSA